MSTIKGQKTSSTQFAKRQAHVHVKLSELPLGNAKRLLKIRVNAKAKAAGAAREVLALAGGTAY